MTAASALVLGLGLISYSPIFFNALSYSVLHNIHFTNVDGAIVLDVHVHAGRCDTLGAAILDTGAGYLAIDAALCGAGTSTSSIPGTLAWSRWHPDSLTIGSSLTLRPGHTLALDLAPMRDVADLPLLALLGQDLWGDAAIAIDYRRDSLSVWQAGPGQRTLEVDTPVAASRAALGPAAIGNAEPFLFELLGDGKIVIAGAIDEGPDTLTWILDTGATKSALFTDALAAGTPLLHRTSLRGLSAPTVMGAASMRLVRTRQIRLRQGEIHVQADGVDVALVEGPLGRLMSQAIGRRVHGLLGYSFLRRFRTVIDYPHRVLWLERVPVERDARAYEYSSIGVQLRRDHGRVVIDGVVDGSPAAQAALRPGDELLQVDGAAVTELPLAEVSELLEGPSGSRVNTLWRRGGRRTRLQLTRMELL